MNKTTITQHYSTKKNHPPHSPICAAVGVLTIESLSPTPDKISKSCLPRRPISTGVLTVGFEFFDRVIPQSITIASIASGITPSHSLETFVVSDSSLQFGTYSLSRFSRLRRRPYSLSPLTNEHRRIPGNRRPTRTRGCGSREIGRAHV